MDTEASHRSSLMKTLSEFNFSQHFYLLTILILNTFKTIRKSHEYPLEFKSSRHFFHLTITILNTFQTIRIKFKRRLS